MSKTVCLSLIAMIFALGAAPLFAQEAAPPVPKNRIVLAPVADLTGNDEFASLKGTIYNVLLVNLKRQERIAVLNEEAGAAAVIDAPALDFESYAASLARSFPGAAAILAEYYVSGEKLHILVNVWDLDTLRVKNSFIETMPADLDLLANIEKMSARIAVSVARDLPPTERDALFQKQIVTSLRKKINDEERLVEEIFSRRHALAVSPGSGLGMGKSAVAWTLGGPFISPVLSIEYLYYFENPMHLRFHAEYLGLVNLGDLDGGTQREISFEALTGFHTTSSFSFSLEAGIALTYDWNSASAALAYTGGGGVEVAPPAERLSLTLPVAIGFSLAFSPRFFINLSLTYNGLTYTFEPLAPSAYPLGVSRLKYAYGFSLWNFVSLSIQLKTGVRF